MKKLVVAVVLAVVLVASLASAAFAGNSETGNGAPSGQHYNLNIIGMQNDGGKNGNSGGNVIFVALSNKDKPATRIDLLPGEYFEVIDYNGLDGRASFQLPVNVSTEWEVWIRALGNPKGTAEMRTCGENVTDYVKICGDILYLEAHGNNNKFSNESAKLLYVNGIPLFSPLFENYFWEYDNNGLKLAQLRFYPMEAE